MFLSIVVPVYNAEKYLRDCLESIISSLSGEIEIILIDDGSSDSSGRICDEYSSLHNNIVVIHQENKGSVAARLNGLLTASGEYVTFLDSDDAFDKGYLPKCIKELKCNKPAVLITGLTTWNNEYRKPFFNYCDEGIYDKQRIINEIYPVIICANECPFTFGIYPSLCAKFFLRSLVLEFYKDIPKDISLGDDATVTYPCLLAAESIEIVNDTGYLYRFNPKSQTHSFNPILDTQCINLSECMHERFSSLYVDGLPQVSAYIRDLIVKSVFINNLVRQPGKYNKKREQFLKWIKSETIKKSINAKPIYKQSISVRVFSILIKYHFLFPLYCYYKLKKW